MKKSEFYHSLYIVGSLVIFSHCILMHRTLCYYCHVNS